MFRQLPLPGMGIPFEINTFCAKCGRPITTAGILPLTLVGASIQIHHLPLCKRHGKDDTEEYDGITWTVFEAKHVEES